MASTYIPSTNAAARGASHTVLDEATGQRIQLVPGAAGYDLNAALPYLGEIASRGDTQLAGYLKEQGVYDQAAGLWNDKYQGLVQQDLNAFRDLASSRGISLPSNLGEEHLGMYQSLLDMVELEKQSGGSPSPKVEADVSDLVTLNPSALNKRGITSGGAISSPGIVSSVLAGDSSAPSAISGVVYGPDGTEYASSSDAISNGVFNYLYFPPSATSSTGATKPKLNPFDLGTRNG